MSSNETLDLAEWHQVFKRTPELQRQRQPTLQDGDDSSSTQRSPNVLQWAKSSFKPLSLYFHHRSFLPSFALSLLYLTVLSFGGQMVTYLLSTGYTSTHIGIVRTISVMFEISATWIAPKAMSRIGPVRAGIWFLNYQMTCLGVAVGLFWSLRSSLMAALCLVIGVILSRVGLWGFDLSVQVIVQEVSCGAWLWLHCETSKR